MRILGFQIGRRAPTSQTSQTSQASQATQTSGSQRTGAADAEGHPHKRSLLHDADGFKSGLLARVRRDPLKARFPGVDKPLPHAGLAALPLPWDVHKLAGAGDDVAAAFAQYVDKGFVHLAPPEKAAVLAALEPFMHPAAVDYLKKFHLPRTVVGTDKTITTALESESRDLATLFRFYAPDPTGKLDARAITPELRAKILALPRNKITQRYSDELFLQAVRWRDLPPKLQYELLESYRDTVDPKITLHRITDPAQTRDGKVAPATLQKTLKWEREIRLGIGELITQTSYQSADQRIADRTWISSTFGQQGFHMHGVAELKTPEEKARLGPKLAAFAALQDLAIFAQAAKASHANYTHAFLEPWQAESAASVASSFVGKDGKGTIDDDEILPHKFHFVGMRTGIYGDPDRVGIEIRGVTPRDPLQFDRVCERFVELLASGNIEKLPTPPWPGWDAGDKGIAKPHEDRMRAAFRAASPGHAAFEKRAEMSFDDVFDMCAAGAGTKNGFAFQSPLWNFDAVPGLTDAEKARIAQARNTFTNEMMRCSVILTEAVAAGRDSAGIAETMHTLVSQAAMQFFTDAAVDQALERVLAQAASGAPQRAAP